tara:strand:+ start:389 stop:559 length:171 start_codon:yes stop_codon:yes gene_type:complete
MIFLNYLFLLYYSYFNDLIASIFEAFNAGKIDTRQVIKIEKKDINNIDPGFISDGI